MQSPINAVLARDDRVVKSSSPGLNLKGYESYKIALDLCNKRENNIQYKHIVVNFEIIIYYTRRKSK